MRSSLRLISLLLLLCQLPCMATENVDSVESREYNLLMQVRGQEVTSICMMNISPDGTIVGTVVSEMGMKAFDFTYERGKANVLNVVAFLNKWYIRKVLKKDLAFILSNMFDGKDIVKKKRRLSFLPNGDIEAVNAKFNIHYTFTPMRSEE